MENFRGYKTYLGIAIAIMPTVAGLFGFNVDPSFAEEIPVLSAEFFQIVGSALAFYGRAAAQSPGWLVKQ